MNTLDIFLSRINKTYSNKAQHTENPLLPQAVHITTPVNERIKNLPENFEDVFVIDETYYHYEPVRYERLMSKSRNDMRLQSLF